MFNRKQLEADSELRTSHNLLSAPFANFQKEGRCLLSSN